MIRLCAEVLPTYDLVEQTKRPNWRALAFVTFTAPETYKIYTATTRSLFFVLGLIVQRDAIVLLVFLYCSPVQSFPL
ncbi:hypothetical protein PM082_015809 [Marasmius tenuissimus]|nr:hypothetical protein PM082_015809 [Marasmius tenuissimus]